MTPEPELQHFRAVVIGAGFGGLAAAHALERAGEDFVVLERELDVGGVWQDNIYPAAPAPLTSAVQAKRRRRLPEEPHAPARLRRTAAKARTPRVPAPRTKRGDIDE